MSTRNEYEYADLNDKPELVDEIVELERRLHKQTGRSVTLIAYARTDAEGEESCRAGLND
ncbi:hypothetical protein [Paenibacillus flagellatus]|uniref:Uncharacterized protein n=1 Tax=Paenibacillus flagellatus TaxID=2211139 RepID=A0A2V5K8Y0_9BACL|nr:hypothetical protein [Paenibacillus flagellatus]PYI54514.1 hypothetical protein DLM86_13695 [Paenibacillus flagellatus]